MIVVAGASGFIGRALCAELERRGLRITRVGRRATSTVRWPEPGVEFGDEAVRAFAGARAVVSLAGTPISERWTAARKRAIRDSRVGLTGVLARAIARASDRPPAFVSGSAVGIYGDRGDEWVDESSEPGRDFLAAVARDWEAATAPAADAGVRVVLLRTGVVLGRGGGILGRLALPFQLGGGATLGSGRQWMSWISLGDAIRAIIRAIDDPALRGPVNVVSPEPVRNADFTAALAHVLHRPVLLAVPAPVLRLAFGAMADGVLLASQRARPGALERLEFSFDHPTIDAALGTAFQR